MLLLRAATIKRGESRESLDCVGATVIMLSIPLAPRELIIEVQGFFKFKDS